jgi:hypothetical protein
MPQFPNSYLPSFSNIKLTIFTPFIKSLHTLLLFPNSYYTL